MRHILCCLMVTCLSVKVSSEENMFPIIEVSGKAEILVVPDEVLVTFGVENKHEDLAQATADNDRRASAILAVAKDLGVPHSMVQTSHISVQSII